MFKAMLQLCLKQCCKDVGIIISTKSNSYPKLLGICIIYNSKKAIYSILHTAMWTFIYMATILHCNIPYGLRTYLSVHKNHHINLPALSWLNMSATKVRPQATIHIKKKKLPLNMILGKQKKSLMVLLNILTAVFSSHY